MSCGRLLLVTLGLAALGCSDWGGLATVGSVTDTDLSDNPTDPTDPSMVGSDPTEPSFASTDPSDPGEELQVSFSEDQCNFYVASEERGEGDGTSWMDATPYLRQAMEAGERNKAQGSCEAVTVKIGEGIFLPHPSNPDLSFPLFGDLVVQGGFAGTDEDTRDLGTFKTVLAGRIGEGGPQSLHVLRGSGNGIEEVRLEGVTIQEGRAVGSGDDAKGGGLFVEGLVLSLIDTVIRDNFAIERGGGLWLDGGQLVEGNVRWEDNMTDGDGGALFARDARAYPYFADYIDNRANRGGAVYIQNTLEWFLQRTQFDGNSASEGGAFFAEAGSNLKACRTFFVNNHAILGGALMTDRLDMVAVASTVFTQNTADEGSSVYIKDSESLSLTHLTMTENGDVGLSNIEIKGPNPWHIYNSILWRNGISFLADELPMLEYNLLEGLDGVSETNLSADPRFEATFSQAPETWDLSVASDSIVIDAGSDDLIRRDFCNQDVMAGPRSLGDAVDIGAYEFAP